MAPAGYIYQELECLSKPAQQRTERNERAGDRGESVVDVEAAFVADSETTETVEPGECALNDPPMAA